MKKSIQGPCLDHCYKDEKLIYLLIGFILGALSVIIVDKILKKNNENKAPPSIS